MLRPLKAAPVRFGTLTLGGGFLVIRLVNEERKVPYQIIF